jgi:hypothetical protein
VADQAPDCPNCGKKMKQYAKTAAGRPRYACRSSVGGELSYCHSTTNRNPSAARKRNGAAANSTRPKVFKRKLDEDSGVYIITAAQNGTPVHEVFWRCLLQMTEHLSASLMVVPIRYKNPTSRWTASQANDEHWADEVTPYLWNTRKVLNQNLVLLGDIKTQPTASDPLNGFEAISGSSSAILGHTKLQERSVATPTNRMAKIMTTTGACTVPNYTDSKAGKLGHFHHSLCALVVEVVNSKRFHIRQLNFDTKTESFTDLNTRYYADRVERAPRAKALVMGDTHVDFISKSVERATFGRGGIVDTLKPETLIWHDLLDAYSCNPHHKGNPFNAIAKMAGGMSQVGGEVDRACHYVKSHTPADTMSVVVPSNHNDFLRRWIINNDWRQDPANARFYLKTALQMVEQTTFEPGFGTRYPSPLPMLFPQIVDCSNIDLLVGKNNFAVADIELIMHGDRGPNGARGSIRNHRRLGVRSIIGHSHSPGIEEGCYQVGTSTELTLEYTEGAPSSWLNAHCVINADGKRQMIVIVDGQWRG